MHITTLLLLGLLKTSTGIHLKKRAYSQDCANLSGVALNVDMGDGTTYYAGDIAGCGCASEAWVENTVSNSLDDAVSNAVSVAGLDATVSAITSLTEGAGGKVTCNYPDHAIDNCSPSNLCNFLCSDGFSKSGTTCICRTPKTVCNGVCQTQACSTTGMRKRDMKPSSKCPVGFTACGVKGQRGGSAYECVDAKYDTESCGGCRISLPRHLLARGELPPPRGRDCANIQGSKMTTCEEGHCKVLKCQAGWRKSPNNKSCLQVSTAEPQQEEEVIFAGPWRV